MAEKTVNAVNIVSSFSSFSSFSSSHLFMLEIHSYIKILEILCYIHSSEWASVKRRLPYMVYQLLSRGGYWTWSIRYCQEEVTRHSLPDTVKRRLLDMVYSNFTYTFHTKMIKTKTENAKKGNMCLFFHIIDSQTKFSRWKQSSKMNYNLWCNFNWSGKISRKLTQENGETCFLITNII